jgi:hypothetical protein
MRARREYFRRGGRHPIPVTPTWKPDRGRK